MRITEKITGSQLGLLVFSFITSTILLTIPGFMVGIADQSAWLSVIPSSFTAILSIWVMIALAKRYPGLTIIEYASRIVGKTLGACLGVLYIYFWFASISVMTIQHTIFINTLLLPNSPSIVGSMTILVLCGLSVAAGIEVIGRCNEFLVPLILLALLPLLVLVCMEANPALLKPIGGVGIFQILQGAIIPGGAFMSQFFILGWLLPYLNKPKTAAKVSFITLSGVFLSVFIIVLLSIMILGPLTSKLNYSWMSVIQYIGIEGSFERLEAVAVAMWVMGNYVKLTLALFILCLCVSQVFGIRSYRDVIAPLTLLSIVGSAWIFKSPSELHIYLAFIYPSLGFVVQILIPLLLLIVDSVKKPFLTDEPTAAESQSP